jgi:hypothetical protein
LILSDGRKGFGVDGTGGGVRFTISSDNLFVVVVVESGFSFSVLSSSVSVSTMAVTGYYKTIRYISNLIRKKFKYLRLGSWSPCIFKVFCSYGCCMNGITSLSSSTLSRSNQN